MFVGGRQVVYEHQQTHTQQNDYDFIIRYCSGGVCTQISALSTAEESEWTEAKLANKKRNKSAEDLKQSQREKMSRAAV